MQRLHDLSHTHSTGCTDAELLGHCSNGDEAPRGLRNEHNGSVNGTSLPQEVSQRHEQCLREPLSLVRHTEECKPSDGCLSECVGNRVLVASPSATPSGEQPGRRTAGDGQQLQSSSNHVLCLPPVYPHGGDVQSQHVQMYGGGHSMTNRINANLLSSEVDFDEQQHGSERDVMEDLSEDHGDLKMEINDSNAADNNNLHHHHHISALVAAQQANPKNQDPCAEPPQQLPTQCQQGTNSQQPGLVANSPVIHHQVDNSRQPQQPHPGVTRDHRHESSVSIPADLMGQPPLKKHHGMGGPGLQVSQCMDATTKHTLQQLSLPPMGMGALSPHHPGMMMSQRVSVAHQSTGMTQQDALRGLSGLPLGDSGLQADVIQHRRPPSPEYLKMDFLHHPVVGGVMNSHPENLHNHMAHHSVQHHMNPTAHHHHPHASHHLHPHGGHPLAAHHMSQTLSGSPHHSAYSLAAAAAAMGQHHSQIHELKSQGARKKVSRIEPVPQSGFKGVSWNSRMKAWLAFYVTENGERKSKTFSTRKLGMEEARIQAINFCKEKQDTRREARRKSRDNQGSSSHLGSVGRSGSISKMSSDESVGDSPGAYYPSGHGGVLSENGTDGDHSPNHRGRSMIVDESPYGRHHTTTVAVGVSPSMSSQPQLNSARSEIAYVPIVPIELDMVVKSGLLEPLELTVLPPCQHCQRQPYPFLMIVAEGQENSYSGASIVPFVQDRHQIQSPSSSAHQPPQQSSQLPMHSDSHSRHPQSAQAQQQQQQQQPSPQQQPHHSVDHGGVSSIIMDTTPTTTVSLETSAA